MWYIDEKTHCPFELVIEIFLCPILNLCIVELAAARQLICAGIKQNHSVALNLRFEIVCLGECIVKFVDAIVDELRVSVERPILVLEKSVLDLLVQR